jgi:hypothetical protein
MVLKNNALATGAAVVARALPTLHVIYVRRQPALNVQSILRAREVLQGSRERPYGVGDPHRRAGGPVEDVCAQVLYHEREGERQRAAIGARRAWVVDYEDVCRDRRPRPARRPRGPARGAAAAAGERARDEPRRVRRDRGDARLPLGGRAAGPPRLIPRPGAGSRRRGVVHGRAMVMLGRRLGARHVAALLVGLAIAVAACGGDGGGGDDFEPISISQARAQPFGAKIKLTGFLSTPTGVYESIYGDQGFVIQFGTDGIYITTPTDPGLEIGTEVRIEGRKVDVSGTVAYTADVIFETGEEGEVGSTNNSTGGVTVNIEGRLVLITGTVTEGVSAELPAGYAFVVDDGSGPARVFVAASTGFDPRTNDDVRVGQQVSVIGVVARVDGAVEVLPRFASDILPPF